MRAAVRRIISSLFLWMVVVLAGCGGKEEIPAVPDLASERAVDTGRVVGFVGEYGAHVWRGIPYAAPPVGDLRWRAPQPPAHWQGRREALRFGSVCPQIASPFGGVVDVKAGTLVGNEDCLTLNVYAPPFAAGEVPTGDRRLPVMVWIHGGGNVIGHGSLYNGGHLATRENVIVVTANYRLGPLGWFRHAALRAAADADSASGNFGLLDQIQALKWVRANISAFGGDPGNVTIFGESAGGRDVFGLLVSPRAAGLFHRAIVQSGGLRPVEPAAAEDFSDAAAPGHRNSSNEVLLRLLIADGKAADRAAAKTALAAMTLAQVRELLYGTDAFGLISTYNGDFGEGLIDVPNVFADGSVLPADDWLAHFARPDGYNRVPVMLGTNRDETKVFMFANPAMVRRILWVVPRMRDEALYQATAAAASDLWKLNAVDEPAATMVRNGGTVFAYRWDWDEEPTVLGADLAEMVGAAHGLEIPFVFGHFDLGPEANRLFDASSAPGREELSNKMMAYWAEFARHGDPDRGGEANLPRWQRCDASRPDAAKFIVLDTEADGGVRMSSDSVTRSGALAAISASPALPSDERRCQSFALLQRWSPYFSAADYAQRCPAPPAS